MEIFRKILRVIGKGLFIVTVICFILVTVTVYYESYRSAEARWARDNLEYLSERLQDIGIGDKIDTHGIQAIKYPKPVALLMTATLADVWTDTFIEALKQSEAQTQIYNLDSEYNPYDALSRLVINSEDERVSKIYMEIMYDAALVNPESKILTGEAITEWEEGRDKYIDEAVYAADSLAVDLIFLTVADIILFLMIVGFVVHYGRKRKVIKILKKIDITEMVTTPD